MKKILTHKNGGDTVCIARCDERIYYVVYQDKLVSSHTTLGIALATATNEYISYKAGSIDGWLSHE